MVCFLTRLPKASDNCPRTDPWGTPWLTLAFVLDGHKVKPV